MKKNVVLFIALSVLFVATFSTLCIVYLKHFDFLGFLGGNVFLVAVTYSFTLGNTPTKAGGFWVKKQVPKTDNKSLPNYERISPTLVRLISQEGDDPNVEVTITVMSPEEVARCKIHDENLG